MPLIGPMVDMPDEPGSTRTGSARGRRERAVRVAVVDSHPLVHHGLAQILERTDDIKIRASFTDLGPLLARDGTPPFDVAVVAPGTSADTPFLDAVRALSQWLGVLLLAESASAGDVLAAFHAGALGYLTKKAPVEAYASAIQAVVNERHYMLLHTGAEDTAGLNSFISVNLENVTLSPREQETLSYIARGFTHSQTATRMNVSKATVDTYVARVRAKLSIGNKAELALAALHYMVASKRRPTPRLPKAG